jgi:hypothetical protein
MFAAESLASINAMLVAHGKGLTKREDGMAERQPQKRTTPLGWFVLAILFVLLGIGGWGIATDNGLYGAISSLPILLALLIFKIISDRRAKRDPEYARRIEEARVRATAHTAAQSNSRQTMTSVGLAVAGFTAAMLGRKYIPGFSSLPREQQKSYLLIGLIAANVLGFIVYQMWKARRGRKSGLT